jgi:hypothetical protein
VVDCQLQRREVLANRVLNDLSLGPEVLVRDDVPQASVVRPSHLWRLGVKLAVNSFRCLADDKKVEEDSVENEWRSDVRLSQLSPDMILDCLQRVRDVTEAFVALARHIGTASLSASMRAGSRSMSMVATSTGRPSASLSSRRSATRSSSVRPG